MIKGIGIDTEEISRIRSIFDSYGDRFMKRILSPAEIASIPGKDDPVNYLAGRFAAKEAFFKAAERDLKENLKWVDVQILRGDSGEPKVKLSKEVQELFFSPPDNNIHCSISHSRNNVVAVVIIE